MMNKLGINLNILECKVIKINVPALAHNRINLNILECKEK